MGRPRVTRHSIELPEVQLGKTDLRVTRLGIGGGRGLSAEGLRHAARRGVNFFFWCSDFHHHVYQRQTEAIRDLFGDPKKRGRLVLAVETVTDHPDKVIGVIRDQLLELNLDYVDVFFWGWMTQLPTAAHRARIESLKDPQSSLFWKNRVKELSPFVLPSEESRPQLVAQQVSEEIEARGYARYVGCSFHDRTLVRPWAESGLADVLMVRHNPCETTTERDLGELVQRPRASRPGLICFNAYMGVIYVLERIGRLAHASSLPPPEQFYRFVWQQPWVDMLLAGPQTAEQVDRAIEACCAPPLRPEELERLKTLGRELAEEDAGSSRPRH